jgi:hypothetical protein
MAINPQILAISDVTLACRPDKADAIRSLYRDVLRLRELSPGEARHPHLIFAAHQRRIQVILAPDAAGSPMRRRLVIEVDSLHATADQLADLGLPWWLHWGIGIGDRRLALLDPGDNRIELKQVYPL